VEALPEWLQGILHGPSVNFLNLLETSKTLDDWGVAADFARYRKYDDELMFIAEKIRALETQAAAADHNRRACSARLEAARVGQTLGYLEGLAPLPSRRRRRHSEEEEFDIDDQVARPVRARTGRSGRGRLLV